MKRFQNFLKRRTFAHILLIFGGCFVVTPTTLWLPIHIPELSLTLDIFFMLGIYFCMREAVRRDKLVKTWDTKVIVVEKK